jgi:hypothetical protein
MLWFFSSCDKNVPSENGLEKLPDERGETSEKLALEKSL